MKRNILETEKLNNKENKTKKKTLDCEKRYRALFDKMLNGFALCKLLTNKKGNPVDYIFLEVNKAFEKINSMKKEEVINKKVSEVFGFKVIPDLEKYAQIALQGKKKVFETYIPRYNKYFKISSYSPKKGYFITIFEDITELKRAKEREKKHAFEMDFLYKTALDFIQLDPKEDIYRFIGRKLKEIVGNSIVSVNSYDKASDSIRVRAVEGVKEKIRGVLKIIGKDLVNMSFPIKNEEARNAFISGELTKVPGGLYKLTFGQIPKSICHVLEKFLNVGKIYTVGFAKGKELFGNTLIILPKNVELKNREFINIFTKQAAIALQKKQAEEKIQELNKRLNLLLKQRTKELIKEQNYTNYLLEFSPDFQITIDCTGKIMGVNQAFEEIAGKKREKLIGSFIYEFIPKEVIKEVRNKIFKEKKVKNVEITINVPKKEPLVCDFSGAIFANIEGEDGIYLSGRDMTERRKLQQDLKEINQNLEKEVIKRTKELKRTQEQLIQSEKLSIIGQLAAGVAHEIRNPLTTMSLAIEHLEKKCYGDFQKNKLKVVQKNIIRINKIIQGLLTFSRPYSFNFTCENVNVIVERLEPILEELHPRNIKDIKIIKRYNPKLPEVWVDSDHLERVFLNLALNAIEAMGYNGELYISTSYDPKQKKIKIKFKDTGCGIAEENLKKIFHPFFTTRKDGIGLGLSICQMIINEHKGNISAESRLGEGTTFTILLPLDRRRGRQIND